jgi:sigma-B regulation protein RsbU (phosphoserine phosphatase)
MTSRRQSPSIPQRQERFEQATLFEFTKVVNASTDLTFTLGHLLLTIMGRLLAARGMALLAHGKGMYRVELTKGFPASLQGTQLSMPTVPRTLVEVSALAPRRYPWVRTFQEWGVAIIMPLTIGSEPVGAIAFGPRLSKKRLLAKEVTYLRSLANLSATAIEKMHRIAELQQVNRKLDRKVQELNTLFDMGREFGVMLDPDKLIRLFVFSLMGQIGVSRYLICLKDGPDMRVVASKINGPVPQSELLDRLSGQKTAVTFGDMVVRQATDPRVLLGELGLRVIVPMQMQGESRGLVLLGEKLSREPYSREDLEFLTSLCNLAIISLENARLFKEALEKQKLEDELMIARDIQKGLLPSVLPTIEGIELVATNISSKQVGGDYYDVIRVGADRHIIAIGDVSGKGTPAALLMANLQATIRALVPLQLSLSELTGRVNDLMCLNTGGNKFVTFFWGIVDAAAMTLRYVNAGHNYPYLIRADGAVERLESGGMILGILPTGAPYLEATLELRKGDLLVLFTDGISEAMDKEGKEYGEDRLEVLVRDLRTRTAAEVMTRIHDDILRHTRGAPQSDDITMMVLRVVGDRPFPRLSVRPSRSENPVASRPPVR